MLRFDSRRLGHVATRFPSTRHVMPTGGGCMFIRRHVPLTLLCVGECGCHQRRCLCATFFRLCQTCSHTYSLASRLLSFFSKDGTPFSFCYFSCN
uniref:Secreted protein n=1 Tax=Mesocestoides corti TaxID=53468 RepID=A0A5K3G173_MESCO